MDNDYSLLDYLPHRPPMLLLSRIVAVSDETSTAEVEIIESASFYVADKGVPAWIGIEYMGQTAALIAGYQKLHRQLAPHTGFLLGTRSYQCAVPWFAPGSCLRVNCRQAATVGESLATFDCELWLESKGLGFKNTELGLENTALATARLSVLRQQTLGKIVR